MGVIGVLDPVAPSVDQTIQVIVTPGDVNGVTATAHDADLGVNDYLVGGKVADYDYVVPRGVVCITSGKTSSKKRKAGMSTVPVMAVTASAGKNGSRYAAVSRTADKQSEKDPETLVRFAGISFEGISNGKLARENQDAAGRIAIQMHGVATLFFDKSRPTENPAADGRGVADSIKDFAGAKYGDYVWIRQSALVANGNRSNADDEFKTRVSGFLRPSSAIHGVNEEFRPFDLAFGPTPDDNAIVIGNLVDKGPGNRNEVRVLIDSHHPTQKFIEEITMSGTMAGGMAGGMGDDDTAMARLAGSNAGAAAANGLASGSGIGNGLAGKAGAGNAAGIGLAIAAHTARRLGQNVAFGTAIVGPTISTDTFRHMAKRVENMNADDALVESVTKQHDAVAATTAMCIQRVADNKHMTKAAWATTTTSGTVIDAKTLSPAVIAAGTAADGSAPHILYKLKDKASGETITEPFPGIAPPNADNWGENVGKVFQKFNNHGPLSAATDDDIQSMTTFINQTLT